jgi:predicted permease
MPATVRALRAVSRRPFPAVLLVLSLALGIAIAAATFGVVDAVLFRPLPFADERSLVFVFASVPDEGVPRKGMSALNYQDLAREARSFSAFAAVSQARPLTLGGREPRRVQAGIVSAGFFETLGVRPLSGRTFGPGTTAADDAVAMVSSRLWERELGAGAGSSGSAILVLDEQPFEVVGVVPPTYRGMLWDEVDVWLPLPTAARLLGPSFVDDRAFGWLTGVARLQPGATTDQAARELVDLTVQLERDHPGPNRGHRAVVEPLRRLYFGDDLERALLYLLLGAGGILLLCALNAGSLVTSEALARRRELATLLAMGASRRHVFALFALPLALEIALAAALGSLGARFAARWLMSLSDVPPASFTERFVDGRVLGVALGVSAGLTLALAMVPLLVVRRSRLGTEIREGARSSRRQLRLRAGLAVLEVALAIVLLVGSGLMLRSVEAVTGADPGFRLDHLLTLDVALQTARYADPDSRRRYAERVLDRLAGEPAVAAAAVAGPRTPPESTILSRLELETRRGIAAESIAVYRSSVSPSYLATLGVPLLSGRDLSARDREGAPPVALVSRSVADALRGGADLSSVIGKRLRLAPRLDGDPEEAVWTIVGVAGDVRGRGTGHDATGELDVYLPFAQAPPRRLQVLARGDGDEEAAARAIRDATVAEDAGLAREAVSPMRARYAEGAADQRFGSVLVGSLAWLALVLTAIGFYGLFHLTVRAREQELGVRLSLGAKPRALFGMILLQGFAFALAGLTLGLAGAFLLHRWIGSFLHGTSAADPLVLAVAILVLMLVVLAGSIGPALRAMRIDPARTLWRVE